MVKTRTFTAKKKVGSGSRNFEVIERLAVGDDGEGMPKDLLHKVLQLGFSSRYNSRVGMGRFGVGAKLGGISQAKRIEIFSRQNSDSDWLFTYVDLEEIENGKDDIPEPTATELPSDCSDLVGLDRGTLVVWSKADRLQERADRRCPPGRQSFSLIWSRTSPEPSGRSWTAARQSGSTTSA